MLKVDNFSQRLVGKRVFYGWAIVAIALVTGMVSAGISAYGLAFFVVPMSMSLGVSRAVFSSITLFRLAAVPVAPIVGVLLDKKHGSRLLLTFGSIAAGIMLLLTARVQSIWEFYLIFGVGFGLAITIMGGNLIAPAVIPKWFVRKRGRAIAVGTMGISMGGLVVAPLVGWLIAAFDWRTSWAILGAVVIVAISPLSAVFMRRSPEDIGLLPDGDVTHKESAAQNERYRETSGDSEYPWTVWEALRTRTCWVILGVQLLGFTALSPVIIHQVAYIRDKGFSPQTATLVATSLAFFAMVAKLTWGYLAERVHVQRLFPFCLLPAGLSLLLLIWARSTPMLYAYALLHGLTMGGFPPLVNLAWSTYFGRRHMGAIQGVVAPISNLISALSPVLAGWLWDLRGSYALPFVAFAVMWLFAGLLMMLARTPKRPDTLGTQLRNST